MGQINKYEREAATAYGVSKMCTLAISCKEITDALLLNFNITPRKSLTLQKPNLVDEDLIASYIKGIIDGDGSIASPRVRITIYGTEAILSWINIYFNKWTPKTGYKKATVNKIKDNLYYYSIGDNRAKAVYNRLIALDTYCLKRKWRVGSFQITTKNINSSVNV